MEQTDIEKIEKIIHDRKYFHKYLSQRSETYRAFEKMAQAAFSEGELDRRTKELMAVAISAVIDCEACMEWHIGEALRLGASDGQIIEALDVATEMGGGPVTVAARFGLTVVEYYRKKAQH